jgi:periplasmic nitrate reductase NapD
MPIGGFVISVAPADRDEITAHLNTLAGVDIHGVDAKGNIVAVMETETSEEMDAQVLVLEKDERVLSVGLAYLNAEDEIEKIANGELQAGSPFGRNRKNRS